MMYGSGHTCVVDAHSIMEVKVCDICGDAGFEEMLAVCSECSKRAEHFYCMQTLMDALPKDDWFCECCKLQKELKFHDLPSSLLQSWTGSSNLAKLMNNSNANLTPTLLDVEKSKVNFIKHSGLDDLTPAMPAKIVSDAPKVLKRMPNIGGSASVQESVGLSETLRSSSKQIAFKVPKAKTLTAISLLADTSTDSIGTVNNTGCLSGNSSTTIAVSSPQKGPKNNSEFSGSLSAKVGKVAENTKRHEGTTPVSCSTSASGSSLQSRPSKHMVSHRSLYEDLPSFLLSSRPPKFPKRQVSPSILFSSKPPKIPKRQVPQERAAGDICFQVGQKLLAGSSLSTYATHPHNYDSEKSSDFHHSNSIEIYVDRNIDINKVPEHKLRPNTNLDTFLVDQEICASIPSVENIGSTSTFGGPCAVDSEKQTFMAPLGISVETSDGLKACQTEPKAMKEGTSVLPETAKCGTKLCVRSSCNEDRSKPMEIETSINSVTPGCTISVQNIDTTVVAMKNSISERENEIAEMAGTAKIKSLHEEKQFPNRAPLSHCKFDGLAAQTESTSLETVQSFSKQLSSYTSIVVTETLSMQVDYSSFMKAPGMASCVSMPLLHARESGCLNISDACKSPSEKGTIDSDAENMRRMTMLFANHDLGLTSPRVPARPKLDYLWRGGFQVVTNGKTVLYDGIVAHASNRAMDKVYHATREFPSVLRLEEVQRGDATDSWPMQFIKKPPNDDSIALYFFATNNHSFDCYRRLLDRMVFHDMALKGVTDTAEILVYPSSLLPKQFQSWNQLMYIWGVFRKRKHSKMENMSDTPRSVCPDVGGLLPLKPRVAKESITEMLPVAKLIAPSNTDGVGEEHMDVDMESGKEIGISDRPVKGPAASNPDPISSEMEIFSAFPQVSQARPVPNAAPKQDTSAFTVSAEDPSVPINIADLHHSHEKVDKSGELYFPPGFGFPPHAAPLPDQPHAFENCSKISDKNSCHGLRTASAHASSRFNKEGFVKRSYPKTHQSPPSSPKERVHRTGYLESRSHRHRHSSSNSEISRFHKIRKKHENLSDWDQLYRRKYEEKAKCQHFPSMSTYRREPYYRVDEEMERRNTRDSGGRYEKKSSETRAHRESQADYEEMERRNTRDSGGGYELKNSETRAHRENQSDYYSEKSKLSKSTIHARFYKNSYSRDHSRLQSQRHSRLKMRY